MKIRIISFLAVMVAFAAGCSNADEGTYVIKGKVTLPVYEGRTVYLQDALDSGVVYDSTTVVDGEFLFKGEQDEPVVRKLVMRENDEDIFPVILPLVLENAVIEADLGMNIYVGNTRLNRKMMKFLLALEEFRGSQGEVKDPDDIKPAFAKFLKGQIRRNSGNVVGEYISEAYKDKL